MLPGSRGFEKHLVLLLQPDSLTMRPALSHTNRDTLRFPCGAPCGWGVLPALLGTPGDLSVCTWKNWGLSWMSVRTLQRLILHELGVLENPDGKEVLSLGKEAVGAQQSRGRRFLHQDNDSEVWHWAQMSQESQA